MELLTTQQAADRLGLSLRRLQTLVQTGRLPASRFGRALVIREEDLALVAERKWGRPPKLTDADSEEASAPEVKPAKATKKAGSGKPAKKARKKSEQ